MVVLQLRKLATKERIPFCNIQFVYECYKIEKQREIVYAFNAKKSIKNNSTVKHEKRILFRNKTVRITCTKFLHKFFSP